LKVRPKKSRQKGGSEEAGEEEMKRRRVPWLVAGLVCGSVGGLLYWQAEYLNNPELRRGVALAQIVWIGAAVGLVLGLVADILASRRR
jgi:hypothetical protein